MCSSASQGAVTRLRSVLAELSAEDLKGMFGPQVLDRTAALLAAKNMLDAELARTVREGELTQAADHDGLKTMASWLRGHARLSPARSGSWCATGGRWRSCRRWPRRLPAGRSPPTRSR